MSVELPLRDIKTVSASSVKLQLLSGAVVAIPNIGWKRRQQGSRNGELQPADRDPEAPAARNDEHDGLLHDRRHVLAGMVLRGHRYPAGKAGELAASQEESMKRLLLSLLAASALALSMAGIVVRGGRRHLQVRVRRYHRRRRPAHRRMTPRRTYDFGFNLTTPNRCGGMVYTLYVFDTEAACVAARTAGNTSAALATLVERGADATPARESRPGRLRGRLDLSADTSTWVFATTSKGKATFDVAPDRRVRAVSRFGSTRRLQGSSASRPLRRARLSERPARPLASRLRRASRRRPRPAAAPRRAASRRPP